MVRDEGLGPRGEKSSKVSMIGQMLGGKRHRINICGGRRHGGCHSAAVSFDRLSFLMFASLQEEVVSCLVDLYTILNLRDFPFEWRTHQ